MITYIYPYRNREIDRVKRSLDSLSRQENKDFKVLFIDYGSDFDIAESVEELILDYSFVEYIYSYSEGKPWNRSKALNIGIKLAESTFLLSADIDMIFHPTFNETLKGLVDAKKVTFFKVGYLSKRETYDKKELIPESYSNQRAKGISLYPKAALNAINGFDEFFNCWGSEDEDIIRRLSFLGLDIKFYNQRVLVFHQYHKPFKELNHRILSSELSYSQVRYHNDQKRRFNIDKKIVKVNENSKWGCITDKRQYERLANVSISRDLTSFKPNIDFFLLFELERLSKGYWGFKFVEYIRDKKVSLKSVVYRLWTINNYDLQTKEYYTIKEVHDLLLKFLIYQDLDFHISINLESASLEVRLRIE